MHNDLKHHQLAFLLSLGALPIAGCTAADDDGTTNATAATMTGTATNTTMSTGTDETGTATMTTGNPTTGMTTDVSTSGTDTGYADSTTGNIDIPPVCQMYGDHLIKCGLMYADTAAMYCAQALQYDADYGDGCVMADSDYYACLAMTDCAELMDKMATPCEAEEMAYLDACGGSTTGGTGTGGSTSTTM
jgi:hypothetical protein